MSDDSDERPTRRSERSLRAEEAFRARLNELGATLLEPGYLGAAERHRVRCANGHESSPRAADVTRGHGVCLKCRDTGSKNAEARFRVRLADLGVTLLENGWRGSAAYYRCICPRGHQCSYSPDQLSRGRGGCQTCGVQRVVAARMSKAEAVFRRRLAELGATLLTEEYRGAEETHSVRCSNGHTCFPRPQDVIKGRGVCRVCVQHDPQRAEAEFRARLAELGATLLEPRWLGNKTPHRVICAAGHDCRPTPNNASKWGICLRCRGWDTDAFYVVTNEETAVLKLGITTRDGRQRLKRHTAAGFTTVHRFLTGLPIGVAPELERDVLATLRLAGERPVNGREYFPDRVRALVLDVVDNYPISARKASA